MLNSDIFLFLSGFGFLGGEFLEVYNSQAAVGLHWFRYIKLSNFDKLHFLCCSSTITEFTRLEKTLEIPALCWQEFKNCTLNQIWSFRSTLSILQ